MSASSVLLVNPPHTSKESRIQTLSVNLGSLYLAAALERRHRVGLIDLNLEYDLEEEIARFKPDLIGITAYSPQFPFAVELARKIKKRCPEQRIVLGGHHATIDGANILKEYPSFDYVMRGEGEFSLPLLAGGKKNSSIQGLVYRESGKIVDNGPTIVEDLDSVPFPARHLIETEQYLDFPFHYLHHNHTSLMTSRGCPYHCLYCYSSPMKTYRGHSPRYVLSEIKHVLRDGINDFIITDDVFTQERDRVAEICNRILDEGLSITWSCETRPDKVDPELLRLMRDAGCHLIYYGIESGNQQVLGRLGKGFTLETVRRAIQQTKDVGIRIHGGFIFGFPFESKEQREETAEFSKSIGLDGAEFTIATPYPGTALWNLAGKKAYSDLKLLETLNYTSTSGNPFWNSEELAGTYSQAIMGFYFRRKEFFKTLRYVMTEGTVQRRWQLFKYLTFKGPADNTPGPDHDSLPTTPTIIERFFKEQCQLCHGCDHTCKRRWFCYIQKIANGWIYSTYRKGLGVMESYERFRGSKGKTKRKKRDKTADRATGSVSPRWAIILEAVLRRPETEVVQHDATQVVYRTGRP